MCGDAEPLELHKYNALFFCIIAQSEITYPNSYFK